MISSNAMQEIILLVSRYPILTPLKDAIINSIEIITESVYKGGKLLICGNGGSATDSLHIVGELMKGFVLKREIDPALREILIRDYPEDADFYINNLQKSIFSISLVNEIALTTAFSNDKASELVFAQQVLGYGRKGDVLLAISTSGDSENVIHSAKISHALGIKVISLTGENGGKLKNFSDVLINVPSSNTYQIQELHLPVYHAICLALEQEFFSLKR